MDKARQYFVIGGFAAFTLFSLLIALLFLFFNHYQQSKHYVPKQTDSIEVSILQLPSPSKSKPKPVAKSVQHSKEHQKAPIAKSKREAVTKKVKATNSRPAIASLFKGVKIKEPHDVTTPSARLANAPKIHYKSTTKEREQTTQKAESLVRNLQLSQPTIHIASKASGQGEVDAYLSQLYELFHKTWQPEAFYAGAHATIQFEIASDGTFNYHLLRPSDNQAFNQSLIEYLEQMKAKGFPPLTRNRDLVIDVEFKAKE